MVKKRNKRNIWKNERMNPYAGKRYRENVGRRRFEDRRKSVYACMRRAVTAGFCVGLVLAMPEKGLAREVERPSYSSFASSSNAAALLSLRSAGTGDLWGGWIGDMSFLSGKTGNGTEEKPYQISTKAQLMGLSELAAMGMKVEEAEGTYPGDYAGAYFELVKNIDLGGMDWLPIGFYRNSSDMNVREIKGFEGHFDGNGKTVSNFRLYCPAWNQTGLFGVVKNAEITDLIVEPGHVVTAGENAGLLAGRVENSRIRNVTVKGTLKTVGNVGGIAGEISDKTVIENCTADHVALDSGTGKETFTGGIAGKAANSLIADCTVNTGDSLSARIQGGGYVGGIVGFQNGTDIFNVHVMGTIGGSGSQSIGGVTGKYASGKMKVARFEGKIASSGLGNAAREGTFIGTRDTGFHFRYGTEAGADLAYLFADTESRISAGICGSGISDDNRFTYGAHIGFWHRGDNFFTLVQGQNTAAEEKKYFYEELEEGMLHVIDTEEAVKKMDFSPDHFAPGPTGRPTRGYLVSVLQIDTAANVENYYDVAVLTAKGGSAYSHELDKSHRGAVAAGDTVTVITAPKNTQEEKYQMDGVPTYTDRDGKRVDMACQKGGLYSFVMPEHDTELTAVYKKVAASVRVVPEEFSFHVTEERTGDRKNPSIVTEVKDGAGKLIARYINGTLEENTQVQEVKIGAVVDKNNDVADGRVLWSVDDKELLHLKKNGDEDSEGYTGQSAVLELNLQAGFFRDIIAKAEREQAGKKYQYPIPDTIYGNGTLGGLAVLTAETRPAASFEGKPLTANCRIPVTFQIKDRTKVAAEGAGLDKSALSFTVTRVLSGDRKNPEESIKVTGPESLCASFYPDYFDKKDISWTVDDKNIIQAEAGGYGSGNTENDYKNASVRAVKDAKWIQDIMAADDAAYKEDPYRKRSGFGERRAFVTVKADDSLGNKQTASCEVKVSFVTLDRTEIKAEAVNVDKEVLEFDMVATKTGSVSKPVLSWTGTGGQKLTAEVLPEEPDEKDPNEKWPQLSWEADQGLVRVSDDGIVVPVTEADWITEAMKAYPYTAEKEATVLAKAGEQSKAVKVLLKFKMVNKTYSSSRGSSGGSSSGGGSGSGSGSSTGSSTDLRTVGGVRISGPVVSSERMAEYAPAGSVCGAWLQGENGEWLFKSGGHLYMDEWAYIFNTYAKDGQEKASWFRFDQRGIMQTGWFKDPSDGSTYYLQNVSDGSLGRMCRGWEKIDGFWYYFGQDGRMARGWHWIDGKCYYLDLESGKMLSDTVTPDGYTVDGSGAWTENGEVKTLER